MAIPVEIEGIFQKNDSISVLRDEFGSHKRIPALYEGQILEALSHFPELRNVYIKFRIRPSLATAKTKPDFTSMFLPKGKRRYIVTISNSTSDTLKPLLLENLPYGAQVGLLGHELSHVTDFSKKSSYNNLRDACGHLSAAYIDRLEYHSDMIAIEHGLGKYLQAWSSYIRHTYHVKYWRGADYAKKFKDHIERYMNPETIEKYMK